MLIASFATGAALGASLIIAIGAQNAFVLRQGLARQHVLTVVLLCAGSDALLIAAGVAGLSVLQNLQAGWIVGMRVIGSAYLCVFGIRALLRAASSTASSMAAQRGAVGHGRVVATTLALTFLNPHVYLDTVLLLGAAAQREPGDGRYWFAAGAMIASIVWFTLLGFGAVRLAPLFAKPAAWRWLDGVIGITVLAIAARLAWS
ncbi:MAG: LysE/ArgO family amino acid transporter [Pseudomonadota bacterium]|nr:LysE/ArgO family amino acid transporter [Pseudomonadota bacterium]